MVFQVQRITGELHTAAKGSGSCSGDLATSGGKQLDWSHARPCPFLINLPLLLLVQVCERRHCLPYPRGERRNTQAKGPPLSCAVPGADRGGAASSCIQPSPGAQEVKG